jgi:hypothetical protein
MVPHRTLAPGDQPRAFAEFTIANKLSVFSAAVEAGTELGFWALDWWGYLGQVW